MPKPATLENIISKLWDKTIIDEKTNCWLFQKGLDWQGHCRIKFKYRMVFVHRLAMCIHLKIDYDDKSFLVLHKPECPNKNCWNFDHLYLGTQRENMRDAITTGVDFGIANRSKLFCKRGHEFTKENTYFDKDGSGRRCKACVVMLKRGY